MPDVPAIPTAAPVLPPPPVAAPVAPPQPAAPPVAPLPVDAWVGTPRPMQQAAPVRAQRGGWEDIVYPLASAGMSLPLAGAGALLGLLNPVAGAVGALVGGSLVGLIGAGQEIWAGSRPGAMPVRWGMVATGMVPAGVTAVGAGIGFAVAGTASAVMWGALAAAAVPFAFMWGAVLWARWKSSNPPPVTDPVVAPAQP